MNDQEPQILSPNGKPARRRNEACPSCGADRKKREPSAGFGEPHDVCTQCGFEFEELTTR